MTGEDGHGKGGGHYRCPYCGAEYPTEMLARVHVTYADDDAHEGRDGMTPEVEPVECDASGDPVGTAFTLAGQLNLHGLSLSDIPHAYDGREFDERERRALLVAAFDADSDRPVTELQDRVTAHLAERDLDPLSTRDLRELCEHVFRPVEADETAGGEHDADGTELRTAETRLRNLTPLQQAIVLAHLACPDSDRTDLATRVGTARSYPTQVIDARPDLVARLRSRLEQTSLERLVAERVPGEDLAEIREEGYLDAFDIDLAAARERKRRRNDPGGPVPEDSDDAGLPAGDTTAATPGDSDDAGPPAGDTTPSAPDSDDTASGRRVVRGEDTADERAPGETSAVPADAAAPFGPDGAEDDGHERTSDGDSPDAGGDPDGHEGPGRAGDSREAVSGGETVPRAEVEAVREQVAFDLAVVEQEMELADPTPQQVRTKAYLEQILERLDEVLS
jgi:hypothetical protein